MKFKDVQIVVADNRPYMSFHAPTVDMWIITYHREYRKWIITNDIDHSGLNERLDKVQIVGYAGDINNALFAIYGHQRAMGWDCTVMDEIREQRSIRTSDEEWAWGRPKESRQETTDARDTIRELLEQNPVFAGWTISEWEPPKKKSWKFWK